MTENDPNLSCNFLDKIKHEYDEYEQNGDPIEKRRRDFDFKNDQKQDEDFTELYNSALIENLDSNEKVKYYLQISCFEYVETKKSFLISEFTFFFN